MLGNVKMFTENQNHVNMKTQGLTFSHPVFNCWRKQQSQSRLSPRSL